MYIQNNQNPCLALQNLSRISISKFNNRTICTKLLFFIEEYEILDNYNIIIGNPSLICIKYNQEIIDENSFSIIQCNKCNIVITHTGYFVKNLCFSYVINCKVDGEMTIKCECDYELGIKLNYYNLKVENIRITKFPRRVLQDNYNFYSNLNSCQEIIQNMHISNSERIKNLEERIIECQKSLKKLSAITLKMYAKVDIP